MIPCPVSHSTAIERSGRMFLPSAGPWVNRKTKRKRRQQQLGLEYWVILLLSPTWNTLGELNLGPLRSQDKGQLRKAPLQVSFTLLLRPREGRPRGIREPSHRHCAPARLLADPTKVPRKQASPWCLGCWSGATTRLSTLCDLLRG